MYRLLCSGALQAFDFRPDRSGAGGIPDRFRRLNSCPPCDKFLSPLQPVVDPFHLCRVELAAFARGVSFGV